MSAETSLTFHAAPRPDMDQETSEKLGHFNHQIDRMAVVLEFVEYKKMEELYASRRDEVSRTIPNFWLIALLHHDEIAPELGHEEDRDALGYLQDIWVVRDEDEPRVYTIEFTFAENPFFDDQVLKKVFQYDAPQAFLDQTPDEDGFRPEMLNFDWERDVKPKTTQISWKQDQDLCSKYPRTGEDNLPEELGSFFNWFTHDTDAFDIGVTIAEDLFPDAIDYYTGNLIYQHEDEEDQEEGEGEGIVEEEEDGDEGVAGENS